MKPARLWLSGFGELDGGREKNGSHEAKVEPEASLMRSIVSFHAARDRFVVFVEMNADKNTVVNPIPERCTIRQ